MIYIISINFVKVINKKFVTFCSFFCDHLLFDFINVKFFYKNYSIQMLFSAREIFFFNIFYKYEFKFKIIYENFHFNYNDIFQYYSQ